MTVRAHHRPDPSRRQRYLDEGWWRTDRTFAHDVAERVERHPYKRAIVARQIADDAAVELTYGELWDRVLRLASGLRRDGVLPGDVVSFQLPNGWEFVATALACAHVGAIANPLLPIHRHREISHIVSSVRSKLCITMAEGNGFDYTAMYEEILSEQLSPPQLRVLGEAGERGWAELLEGEIRADPVFGDPDGLAQVQFTSGTTGRPKGVVHSFNTLYAAYRGTSVAAALTEHDVIFAPSTMAHQTAYLSGCVMPFAEGMTAVYLDRWDPDIALDLMGDYGVTFASGATPFMQDLCSAQRRSPRDLSALRIFKSGGATVPERVRRDVDSLLGAEVAMAWGMTENGVCTMTPPGEGEAGADGVPLPWAELSIRSETGEEKPRGEAGVLWVRSASQCLGYFPDHDLYAAQTDEAGWFDTGDLAVWESNETLRIVGRVKDMIIRGGENLPVVEIEDALSVHPAVADVAVVGVPDDRLGERACAVVVTEPEATFDLQDVRDHLRSIGMAKQYWPEAVVLRDAFPRTSSGKIQKAVLQQQVQDTMNSTVPTTHG